LLIVEAISSGKGAILPSLSRLSELHRCIVLNIPEKTLDRQSQAMTLSHLVSLNTSQANDTLQNYIFFDILNAAKAMKLARG